MRTSSETLLRRLLKVSFNLWSRNTLSTNWILLKTNQDILDIVHDIWIPIDGSDPEKNQIMRVWTKAHFQKALDALKFVQDQRPHIDLTIRTVAASRNIQDIPNIGRVLIENWIDPKRIRWKIYQCSTSGPRRGKTISDGWLISDEEFRALQQEVETANPQFENLKFQPLSRSTKNRYFHVGPNGDLKIVENDIRWLPIENTIGRIGNGNISEQLESIFSQYPDIFIPLSLNDSHG